MNHLVVVLLGSQEAAVVMDVYSFIDVLLMCIRCLNILLHFYTCIGTLFAHFHKMIYRCCGVLYLALKREVQNATQHLYTINLSSNELIRNVLFLTDLERCISLSLFLNRFKYLTNQKA